LKAKRTRTSGARAGSAQRANRRVDEEKVQQSMNDVKCAIWFLKTLGVKRAKRAFKRALALRNQVVIEDNPLSVADNPRSVAY
jgi:hypothetical protein